MIQGKDSPQKQLRTAGQGLPSKLFSLAISVTGKNDRKDVEGVGLGELGV